MQVSIETSREIGDDDIKEDCSKKKENITPSDKR